MALIKINWMRKRLWERRLVKWWVLEAIKTWTWAMAIKLI